MMETTEQRGSHVKSSSSQSRRGRGNSFSRGGRGRSRGGVGDRGGRGNGRGRGGGSDRGRRGGRGRGQFSSRGGVVRGRGRGVGALRGNLRGRGGKQRIKSGDAGDERDSVAEQRSNGGAGRSSFRTDSFGGSRGFEQQRGNSNPPPNLKSVQDGPSEIKENLTNQKNSKLVEKKKFIVYPSAKHSIILKNLPKKVEKSSKELQQFIEERSGPVKALKFSKLTAPKVAVVSATCEFLDPEDAKKAVKALHGEIFNDRHLLVQLLKDFKFDNHHAGKNSVYIVNLSEKTSEEDLWLLFEKSGDIIDIHINRNLETGASKDAIVSFRNPDSIINAMNLDGYELLESSIKVRQLNRQYSVIISKLDYQTTKEELQNLLVDCKVVYLSLSRRKKKELKSALVFLAGKKSFEKALSLNGTDFKGCNISVASAATCSLTPEKDQFYHLYLPSLPPKTSAEEVIKCFSEFGEVEKVTLRLKEGVSGVLFKSKDHAKAALGSSNMKFGEVGVEVCASYIDALHLLKKKKEKERKKKERKNKKKYQMQSEKQLVKENNVIKDELSTNVKADPKSDKGKERTKRKKIEQGEVPEEGELEGVEEGSLKKFKREDTGLGRRQRKTVKTARVGEEADDKNIQKNQGSKTRSS